VSDQTDEVIEFIKNRHPHLARTVIAECVTAMTDWVAAEIEKDHQA
jgi:hypothetical protein